MPRRVFARACTIAGAIAGQGVILFSPSASAQPPTFNIYGAAQADYIYDVDRVDPNWEDTLRPSKIPTANNPDAFGSNGQSSLSVKQSRFGVNGDVPVNKDLGDITFKFEFDLFGTGENEGQTTFRLRHAYAEWRALLAGQTNSVFMDGDIYPNVIDYWGPNGAV
ncbi:MAG TPA: DcaP family trimeric outer membrane transporter, partial [Rhizomicrobium sp.]|nr:DcaP family trimeric outer membrane transporter [Rhizomicrobium sp.]